MAVMAVIFTLGGIQVFALGVNSQIPGAFTTSSNSNAASHVYLEKALERLNEILAAKKEQLKVVQERNAIWRQIDAIIG